jgi:tRNA nucleotidyltransferase (CCA-adding enzyme)
MVAPGVLQLLDQLQSPQMVGKPLAMADEREIDPSRLPDRLGANPAFSAVRRAAEGLSAYVVGGGVRDGLIGRRHLDLDVVVEGEIEPLVEALGGQATAHERFGTAVVQVGEAEIDVARARAETYPEPGALPEVRPASITEDLWRRDFAINAIAYPLSGEGGLLDPHGGVADLEAGRVRVLHPGSFADDPTRALRAARYVARFGFGLDPETERLLAEVDLGTVSEDRITAELARIAAEEHPSAALELISNWGVLDLGTGPRLAAAIEGLLDSTLEWNEYADRATAILLAVAPGEHPSRLRARAAKLARHEAPASPAEVQVLARDHVPEVLAIARAAGAAWLDEYVSRLRHVELEISGYDLIEAGVPEGPWIGRGLNAALAAKLDGEVSGFDDELRVALEATEAGV